MILRAVFLVCLVLAGLAGLIIVFSSGDQPFQGCAVSELKDPLKLAIEQYAETIQTLLTLSTTLVALEAAVLLGFQKGLRLTEGRRILILLSTVAFVLAAYFAVLWKSRLGNILYQGCPTLLADGTMRYPFTATSYAFFAGLLLIGFVVWSAAFERESG
jgi:hypothetical protein